MLVEYGQDVAALLGYNSAGNMVFLYDGVKMICSVLTDDIVACRAQTEQWFHCQFLPAAQGYFTNCLETTAPQRL